MITFGRGPDESNFIHTKKGNCPCAQHTLMEHTTPYPPQDSPNPPTPPYHPLVRRTRTLLLTAPYRELNRNYIHTHTTDTRGRPARTGRYRVRGSHRSRPRSMHDGESRQTRRSIPRRHRLILIGTSRELRACGTGSSGHTSLTQGRSPRSLPSSHASCLGCIRPPIPPGLPPPVPSSTPLRAPSHHSALLHVPLFGEQPTSIVP